MGEVDNLNFEDITRFQAFCYIYSYTLDGNGNPHIIIRRWKDIQQTTTYTWVGETVTTVVVWENI